MSDVLRDLADELALLGSDDDETERVLREVGGLQDLVPRTAPAPSSELAALLGRGSGAGPDDAPTGRRAARRSGAVGAALVVLVSGAGATGLSAAANTLPAPVQERVAGFARSWLPFDLPHPAERAADPAADPLTARPDRARTAAPEVGPRTGSSRADDAVVVGAAPSALGVPRPSATPSATPPASGAVPAAPGTSVALSPAPADPVAPTATTATTGSSSSGQAAGGSSTAQDGSGKDTGKDTGKATGKSYGEGTSTVPRGWQSQVQASATPAPDVADGTDDTDDRSGPSRQDSVLPQGPGAAAEDHPGRHRGLGQGLGQGRVDLP